MSTRKKITNEDFNKLVKKRLKYKIKQSGLNTKEICSSIPISEKELSDLLNERLSIQFNIINKIALFLKLNPIRFFSPRFYESEIKFRGKRDVEKHIRYS